MIRAVSWLALLYVLLLPLGRSGLPLNAQWGDLLFLPLAAAAFWWAPEGSWWRRGDWPLALYLAVTLVTSILSPDPRAGLGELGKQLYLATLFMVFRALSSDPGLTRRLQRAFALVVATVAAVSIPAVFLLESGRAPLSPLGWAGGLLPRLRGAFEAPEFLGNALLVAFALALGLRVVDGEARRVFWSAILVLLAAAEFLTFSHSVAGFAVAAVFFVAGSIPSRSLRAAAWGGALVVFIIVNAASVVNPLPRGGPPAAVDRLSIDLLGVRVEAQLDQYVLMKRVAGSAFRDHPLTGIGPGRFVVESRRAHREGRLPKRIPRGLMAHCAPLGRLAESGILGGLSLFLLWAVWIRDGLQTVGSSSPLPRAAFAALLGLLVNSLNADVMHFRFLWIAVAWMGTPSPEQAADREPLRTRVRLPAASVPTGP
jgi:hypothetical protein